MRIECGKCKKIKFANEFSKNRNRKNGYTWQCKICAKAYMQKPKVKKSKRAYQKRYREKNIESINTKSRGTHIKHKYGITLKQYDKMFEDQGGICKICSGVNINGRRLSIDHNHKTGKVRGLLCQRCNLELGFIEKHANDLERILKYLRGD